MGRFSVCSFVCPFVRSFVRPSVRSPLWAIQPGLRPSQPSLKPETWLAGWLGLSPGWQGLRSCWLGLRPGWLGLRPGWMAQRGGHTDYYLFLGLTGKKFILLCLFCSEMSPPLKNALVRSRRGCATTTHIHIYYTASFPGKHLLPTDASQTYISLKKKIENILLSCMDENYYKIIMT